MYRTTVNQDIATILFTNLPRNLRQSSQSTLYYDWSCDLQVLLENQKQHHRQNKDIQHQLVWLIQVLDINDIDKFHHHVVVLYVSPISLN